MLKELCEYMVKNQYPKSVIETVYKVDFDAIDEIKAWYILENLKACENATEKEYERQCVIHGVRIEK